MDDFSYGDDLWPKTDAKEYIFSIIEPKSKVLDLGCWTGRLGEKLKKKKQCYVSGVDINEKALAIAKTRLNNVYLIDLDQPELLKKMGEKFDYLILADVLEHLKNPQKTLELLKILLNEKGRLIVSLPNIANWTVRWSLLTGKFDYDETGILDKTHLRFFTRKTGSKLLEKSGYKIINNYFTGTRFLPTLKAVQFIFVCRSQND